MNHPTNDFSFRSLHTFAVELAYTCSIAELHISARRPIALAAAILDLHNLGCGLARLAYVIAKPNRNRAQPFHAFNIVYCILHMGLHPIYIYYLSLDTDKNCDISTDPRRGKGQKTSTLW